MISALLFVFLPPILTGQKSGGMIEILFPPASKVSSFIENVLSSEDYCKIYAVLV